MTTENSKYTIIPGGQNAWPPLYRDGQTNDPCAGQGGGGDDPNAPLLYLIGGLAIWEGDVLIVDGEALNYVENAIVNRPSYKASRLEDEQPFGSDENYYRGLIVKTYAAAFAGKITIDGVKAKIAEGCVIPSFWSTELNSNYWFSAPPVEGILTLQDESTESFTIPGTFGFDGDSDPSTYAIDMGSDRPMDIVDATFDSPYAEVPIFVLRDDD